MGDFSIKTNSLSREKLSFNSGSIKNVHYGDILVKFDSILCFDNIHIPFIIDDNKITSKMFLKNGDIIFADAAEDHSVGKCIELTNVLGDIVSGLHTIVYRSQIDFAQYFLGYYLNSNSYRKQIFPLVQGAKVSSISKNNLSITNISFPTLPEQRAIGSFFQELDQLITLQQRELELMKEGKKTLLSKMFPKDGENFPEIRFPGFTDAWEQRKLGAYLTVSKNRNVDGEYDKSDVLSVSGDYGIVNQIKFQGRSFAGASVLPYGIVETGEVVYTKSPLKANPYGIIKTNHGKNGIVSTLYAVYKVNNGSNGIFVEYYFDDNLRLNKYLKPLVNKGAKNDMKVTDENVLKGDVIFPSFPEQTAIGSFFQELDQLITLQQRELEILKTMKSTLLKAMFA